MDQPQKRKSKKRKASSGSSTILSQILKIQNIAVQPGFGLFARDLAPFCQHLMNCFSGLSRLAEWAQHLSDIIQRFNNFQEHFKQGSKDAVQSQRVPLLQLTVSLAAVRNQRTEAPQLLCIKNAVDQLNREIKERSKAIEIARKRDAREKYKLRLKVTQLLSAGLVTTPKDPKSMSLVQLRAFVFRHQHLSLFRSLDLNALNSRSCPVCRARDSADSPPYKPRSDSTVSFINGLFCHGVVTMDELLLHDFLILRHGMTFGTVRVPDMETPEVALFVNIPTLDQMSPETLSDFQELATLLHTGAQNGTRCRSNAAHRAVGSIGIMVVLGWRRAYDSTPWGLYKPPPEILNDPEKLKAWYEYMSKLKQIQEIFNKIFEESMVSMIAKEAQDFVAQFKLPSFGDVSADQETHEQSLGSNFTISFGGFSNQAHLDNDAFRYVFSVYVFVDHEGNLVTDCEKIKACMTGGYFLWPDLHLGLDPSHCSGVVIFMWHGTHERHCTMECTLLENGVTRYGTSIQVNRRLLASVVSYQQRMAKYEENMALYEEGVNKRKPKKPTAPTGLRM